ncbi:CoA pyrophosphatase [Dankookia sp. GCM10030260]|uniref:CoA pyrophosphatase n=1 Tax=Dankookia sp. GCM10030260 TaxID=3273390 RepID=UPI0036167248
MADPAALALVGTTKFNDSEGFRVGAMKFAAVLVPIVLHPRPSILLTLRAAKMSAHAGQVSFPGGRIEAGETPEAAAVREAAEEVGLDPRLPELLGRLPDHQTGTGFHITPVVALVPPPLNLVADPREVEEPFEVPLSLILDPQAPERRSREWQGMTREFWVWPHERHYIWGATAAILVNLAKVLRGH